MADFFPNWDISRGFLHIAGKISAAAMAGDIIFLSFWSSMRLHWGPYCDYSRAFFYYSPEETANLRWVGRGGGGGVMGRDMGFFRVPNSLEGCDGWGEGRGLFYIKASVVSGKVRPWQPRSSFG